MCELALGAQYDLVMVPFYIFNYLLTEEAQNAALERIHTHVSPQGRLLIDVFIPVSRIAYCPPEPVLKVDTVDSRTGHRVRGWNIYAIDTERQIEHRRHIFEIAQPDVRCTKENLPHNVATSFHQSLKRFSRVVSFLWKISFQDMNGNCLTRIRNSCSTC